MNTRRFLAAVIALAAAFAMAGCGAKDKEDSEGAKEGNTSSQVSAKADGSPAESVSEVGTGELTGDETGDYGASISAEGFVYKTDEQGGRIVQGDIKDSVLDARLFTINVNSEKWTQKDPDTLVLTAQYYYVDECSAVSIIADKVDTTKETLPTLDESHETNMQDLTDMGCETIENEEITVDGEKAYLTHASTDLGEGVVFKMICLECWHGDLHFAMQLSGLGESVDTAETDLMEMINSIKFTD